MLSNSPAPLGRFLMPLARCRVTPSLHLNEPSIPLDIEEIDHD